jgi:hypothetical protein
MSEENLGQDQAQNQIQDQVPIKDNSSEISPEIQQESMPTSPENSQEVAIEPKSEITSAENIQEKSPEINEVPVINENSILPTDAPASIENNSGQNIIAQLLEKAKQKIAMRKEKQLEKIVAALAEKRRLTNQEIRKIVRKSDATVVRYLNILEKQGRIRQIGKTGHAVYYELAG